MRRAIVAGAVALVIAGTSVVQAQHRGDADGGRRWQPSIEDLRAFGEARLAALKAGLMLTAEQERNWPAFEQAARDLGKLRVDQVTAMRNATPSRDPVERLRQRATAMADTSAALKKLAEATDPLYKSSRRQPEASVLDAQPPGGLAHGAFPRRRLRPAPLGRPPDRWWSGRDGAPWRTASLVTT